MQSIVEMRVHGQVYFIRCRGHVPGDVNRHCWSNVYAYTYLGQCKVCMAIHVCRDMGTRHVHVGSSPHLAVFFACAGHLAHAPPC